MKISILGTNGFLSNAIAKYANVHGWQMDMYGLTRPEGLHYDSFYEINLMDTDLNCSAMLDSDIIVYAIGAGIQSNLKECADLIYSLNVTSPVNICNKLKSLEFKGIFVTFGSYFELGETDLQRPATEQDIISANAIAPTDYVVSKRMLTRFVTSYKHDFTHWHFILPTIYGPGENPNRLIPYTINAIRNGEELHFTSGEQVRQYLCIDEVPAVIEQATKSALTSGVYNIAGSETQTVKQIVSQICFAFGKEMSFDCFGNVQRTDVGMKYLALNNEMLFERIRYKATITIAEQINLY